MKQSVLWSPCEAPCHWVDKLPISSAQGSYIELANHTRLIDATSSWWCKSFGHNHPRLKAALMRQIHQFEQVIGAGTSYELIEQLSEKLTHLMPGLNKVFYASDGACAVEVAMKMSWHARLQKNQKKRTHFIALKNSYHGETLGALGVTTLSAFRRPYLDHLFKPIVIETIPYVLSTHEPLWRNCDDIWLATEKALEPYKETATAIIVEPILQAAGQMRIYSAHFLSRLSAWAKCNQVHLIVDEIMTGLGRTGKMLACEHAGVSADFVCLGKGLSSGFLPISAVVTKKVIYQQIQAITPQSFLHSHTFSGNALAVSVALEVLAMLEEPSCLKTIEKLGFHMRHAMQTIAETSGRLENVRQLGAMVAADVLDDPKGDKARQICQQAIKEGALMRPLHNTIYWVLPFNTPKATLEALEGITLKAVRAF